MTSFNANPRKIVRTGDKHLLPTCALMINMINKILNTEPAPCSWEGSDGEADFCASRGVSRAHIQGDMSAFDKQLAGQDLAKIGCGQLAF